VFLDWLVVFVRCLLVVGDEEEIVLEPEDRGRIMIVVRQVVWWRNRPLLCPIWSILK
jgi:hypothetical protein